MDPAVAGDWIAGAVGVVTLAGSWFAWRAWRGTKTIDRRNVQPRIDVDYSASIRSSAGSLPVSLRNGGGDARWHRLLVHCGDVVYLSHPLAVNRGEIRVEQLFELWRPGRSVPVPVPLLHIACDVDGDWWDLRSGKRIGTAVGPWVRRRSAEIGLPVDSLQLSPAELSETR